MAENSGVLRDAADTSCTRCMNLHDASVGKADVANLKRSKVRAAESSGLQNISPTIVPMTRIHR